MSQLVYWLLYEENENTSRNHLSVALVAFGILDSISAEDSKREKASNSVSKRTMADEVPVVEAFSCFRPWQCALIAQMIVDRTTPVVAVVVVRSRSTGKVGWNSLCFIVVYVIVLIIYKYFLKSIEILQQPWSHCTAVVFMLETIFKLKIWTIRRQK